MLGDDCMTRYGKYVVLAVILLLSASTVALVYYLAKSDLLSYATGVFWYGMIAGFAGCLFLSSLILTILLTWTSNMSTRKHALLFPMLGLSGLVTAAFWFFKPGDSDVWWYGTITGFLVCLLLVFMGLIVYSVSSYGRVKNP